MIRYVAKPSSNLATVRHLNYTYMCTYTHQHIHN